MILFYVFFSEVLSGIYDNNNEKGEAISKHAEIYRNIYFLFFLCVQFFFYIKLYVLSVRYMRVMWSAGEKKKTLGQVQFSYKNYKIIAFNKNIFCLFPSEPTYTEPHCMLYGVDDNAIIKYDFKTKKIHRKYISLILSVNFSFFYVFTIFKLFVFQYLYRFWAKCFFFFNFLNESFLPLTLLGIAEISLTQHIKS